MKVLKALLTALTVLAVGLTGALLFLHDKNAPRYVQIHEYRRAVSLPHQKSAPPLSPASPGEGRFFVSRWYFCFTKAVRDPLRHGFAVPPLPKGRGFGKGVKFTA